MHQEIAISKPMVGILMGSDSDASVMKGATDILERLGVPYEITILSAHRTPERAWEYAKAAEARGVEVIIAGAGGAAHLPGVVASTTVLPVIGVPIAGRALGGVDSLYSIVQMPSGVPVATVAIDGASNAALLACEILGIKYPEIRAKLVGDREATRRRVNEKARDIEEKGIRIFTNKS